MIFDDDRSVERGAAPWPEAVNVLPRLMLNGSAPGLRGALNWAFAQSDAKSKKTIGRTDIVIFRKRNKKKIGGIDGTQYPPIDSFGLVIYTSKTAGIPIIRDEIYRVNLGPPKKPWFLLF